MGKGFDTFMENPFWRKLYDEAPSEELKEYFRVVFDASGFIGGNEHKNGKTKSILEKLPLSKEDIEYLRDHAGSGQARAYYQKFIDRLSGQYKGWCFPAAAFRVEDRNPYYRAFPETEREEK